jgi:DNA-directed RNA polymerase specialized sigma subunit
MTQHVNRYAGNVPISRPALEGEVTRLTVKALKSYNPTRGAQLSTFVTGQLKGINRFVTQHQNVSRITEDRSQKIGRYQRATSALSESLGRPPTAQETADEMKVSVRMVNRLAQEMRPDLLASGAEHDPFLNEEPRSREVLRLMYPYAFSLDEQKVFEFLLGLNGKEKELKTGKIARSLGWSDSKVSQIRASIATKVKPYLHD